MNDTRPRFLNLLLIRLPIPGVASFLHRVSGALLILIIPFALYGLDLSLRDAAAYAEIGAFFSGFWGMTVLTVMSWALGHHFFTGIRFLLMDLEIGVARAQARLSAVMVMVAGLLCALLPLLLLGGGA